MVRKLSSELLRQRLQAGEITVIDTRPAADFEAWHIPGAKNYPYASGDDASLETIRSATGVDTDDEIVTICGKGKSSHAFARTLEEQDVREVGVVQDGMEGWSRLYELAAVPTVATTLEIFQVQRVAKGCLGYVVGSQPAQEAIVVDPTRHIDEFRRVADDDDMSISRVIDTHVHADHLSGGRELADEVGATYHLPQPVAERSMSVEYTPLARNEVVRVGDVELKAIHTPGHTTESMSLLVGAEAVLTGDTLFVDGVGRTELAFGDEQAERGARRLHRSIHASILSLPDSITVLPGHFDVDEPAAIERIGNPIRTTVRAASTDLPLLQLAEDDFVEQLMSGPGEKPPNYDRVLSINTGEETVSDEAEATELELGPNRCAAAAD